MADVNPAERERRDLLAQYHLLHHRLPPAGERDLGSLRRLMSAPRAMASVRAAAPAPASTQYASMTFAQRAALSRKDPARFEALKREHQAQIVELGKKLRTAASYKARKAILAELQRLGQ